MFGGTPSNISLSFQKEHEVEIVTGVNLPMLIKLAEVREHLTLREACEVTAEAGRKYINIASELMSRA